MTLDRLDSPVGELVLLECRRRLVALAFSHRWERVEKDLRRRRGSLDFQPGRSLYSRALADYFNGNLSALDDIEWDVQGTAFQESVWQALSLIPAGATWSYAQLASQIGRAKAVRAVANAVGANPVSIVLPCHRVVGSNGQLTGFGGGLERKSWLLRHEGVDV